MKTSIFKMMALAVTGFAFAACSDVDIPSPDTQAYPSVSNLTMTQEGRNVTLAWTLPQAENLLGVRIDKNGTLLANVDAPATSYVARHIDKNTDVFFTVKTRYADGVQAEGQTVMARYDGDVTPPAMLLPQADESTLDDDEKAALEWFRANYADGAVLTPADMKNGGVTPDKYGEIWIQVDRVGIAQGWQNLPSELVDSEVIAALADYREAKLEKDNEAAMKHRERLDENMKYFGYGYIDNAEQTVPFIPVCFWAFRVMVGLGMLFLLFFAVSVFLSYKKDIAGMRWYQAAGMALLPLGYIASEAGWIVAEFGRQPWTIQDMLPTWAAVSDVGAGSVMLTFFIFLALFTLLLAVEINIMCKAVKKGPEYGEE